MPIFVDSGETLMVIPISSDARARLILTYSSHHELMGISMRFNLTPLILSRLVEYGRVSDLSPQSVEYSRKVSPYLLHYVSIKDDRVLVSISPNPVETS